MFKTNLHIKLTNKKTGSINQQIEDNIKVKAFRILKSAISLSHEIAGDAIYTIEGSKAASKKNAYPTSRKLYYLVRRNV